MRSKCCIIGRINEKRGQTAYEPISSRIGRLACLALALAFALGTARWRRRRPTTPSTPRKIPIPEIAANVRPSVVGVTVALESWDPVTRVASVDPVSGGSGCYIQAADLKAATS